MEFSGSDLNYIRVSLKRADAEGLSRELGVAKSEIKRKISEMKENDRIKNMLRR